MSRRVVHLVACDGCGKEAEEGQGVQADLALTLGQERKEVDLCDPCLGELRGAMARFLEVGRRPTTEVVAKNVKAARAVATQIEGQTAYACPECDGLGHPKSFSRPQGLGRHRLSVHGVQGLARAGR